MGFLHYEAPHYEAVVVKVTRREVLERWWMLPVAGTAGAFGFMAWYAAKVTFGKQQVGHPAFVNGPAQKLAALADLPGDWSEKEFLYDSRPCTLLRVPKSVTGGVDSGGAHFVAFSRVCTHLGCPVNLVKDLEVLAFAYNYRPPKGERHPQLGCPCHYSVFDPLRGGEAMFGKATRPLSRVRLEVRENDLYATGIEPATKITT